MGNKQESNNNIKSNEENKKDGKKKEEKCDIYQDSNLLWLDPKVDSKENTNYQNKIKEINEIHLFPFTDINDCITKLKKIEFEKTFVVVSGSLSKIFFEKIEKIIKEITVIPEIIIFTSYEKALMIKQNILNLNSCLFNINSVFYFFEEVQEKLTINGIYNPKITESYDFKKEDKIFTFEYINEPKELIFPLYF